MSAIRKGSIRWNGILVSDDYSLYRNWVIRLYAKSPFIWFKTYADIVWIEPERLSDLYPEIQLFLNAGPTRR